MPTDEQIELGNNLRLARERRGVTLAAIADATKVKQSCFAGLERGELGAWPRGVLRRSFFRQYVEAIGLPPGPALDQFARIHPDDDGFGFNDDSAARRAAILIAAPFEPPGAQTRIDEWPATFRITPAGPLKPRRPPFRVRLLAASMDVSAIALVTLIPILAGTDLVTGAAIALSCHVLAAAWLGKTPGFALIRNAQPRGSRLVQELRYLSRRGRALGRGASWMVGWITASARCIGYRMHSKRAGVALRSSFDTHEEAAVTGLVSSDSTATQSDPPLMAFLRGGQSLETSSISVLSASGSGDRSTVPAGDVASIDGSRPSRV